MIRPLWVILALAVPAAGLNVKLKKGAAVALAERPAWVRPADAPKGAEWAPLREGAGTATALWRVRRGWSWAPPPRDQDVVVVVVSGSLRVRAGTLVKTLGPGGAAVFPAGTPFQLGSATWLRRTVFVLVAGPPAS